MLEKDMEELIARYPAEFFPRHEFLLVDRQGSFPGVGRYDLLFKDNRGTNILMELKAKPAKYADVEQLAKYNDALKSNGERRLVLWLVATNIQHSVREFLDTVGIEYTEIHVAEYCRIAEKHGFQITSEKVIEVEQRRPTRDRAVSGPNRTQNGPYRSQITRDFLDRVSTLGEGFEAGQMFLTELASSSDHFDDFRLGTAKNAHLYYKGDFYIYIKPGKYAIELHPNFNGRIWDGATDKHHLLFVGPISRLVTDLDGFKAGWARAHGDGITLTNGTPPLFFERLLELIRQVHQ